MFEGLQSFMGADIIKFPPPTNHHLKRNQSMNAKRAMEDATNEPLMIAATAVQIEE